MQQPLEGVEANQHASRAAGFETHHAADKIEQHQQPKHADDRDGADPAQGHFVEVTPVPAGRLLDDVGFRVRNGPAPLDALELLEELLLLD